MATTVALVVVAGLLALSLPVLTTLGAHRRGLPWLLAVPVGLAFPVTWVVWYVLDEDPYQQAH